MATKADLRKLMLAELTVIRAGDNPPEELADIADLYIDGIRAELNERGLCWWDENDIPDAVTVPLARLLASQSCAAFGKANKGHEAKGQPAMARIAAIKSSAQRPALRSQFF